MSTTLSPTDIVNVIERLDNEYVEKQVAIVSPILDSGLLETVKVDTGAPFVNVFAGANTSTQVIGDGDTLPTANFSAITQGRALPKAFFSRLSFGRIAMTIGMKADDAPDTLEIQLDAAGEEIAQKLGRSLVDYQLAGDQGAAKQWTGTAVGSQVTINVQDKSGYKAGQSIDLCSGSLTVACQVVSVAPAVIGATTRGGANVVLQNLAALSSTNFTGSSVTFFVAGSTTIGVDNSKNVSSIALANNSGSALHNISWNTANWVGNAYSSFGVLDQEKVGSVMADIGVNSGQEPTAVFVNNLVYQALSIAGLTQGATIYGISSPGALARHDIGASLDKYAGMGYRQSQGQKVHNVLTLRGADVLQDPNVPMTEVAFHNGDKTKLYAWGEFGLAQESGGKGSAPMIGRSVFDYDFQLQGFREQVFKKRITSGLASGVTNI